MAEGQIKSPPALPVYYMRMTQANADARLGKLSEGQIVPMDQAKATRYLTANVAEQASESDFRAQEDRKSQKATRTQEAFRNLNEGHAMWDVATYRDVLTAPEGGLRLAHERGIPLVNVHVLRDEDGDPLPPDADIEDILDARELLHTDLQAPFAAHDRSSVMGGGSPFVSNVGGYGSPAPLNPAHREMMERVAAQEAMAQKPASASYTAADSGAQSRRQESANRNEERGNRAARRSQSREATSRQAERLQPPKAPDVPVAPDAAAAAHDAGVVEPSGKLTDAQKA
jgi:hypothetical protein